MAAQAIGGLVAVHINRGGGGHMGVQLIHAISILILLGAGAYALRMLRVSGRLTPWAPLAAVIGVIALFRLVGLVRDLTGRAPFTSVGDELNVLLLSLLLLLGLAHMRGRLAKKAMPATASTASGVFPRPLTGMSRRNIHALVAVNLANSNG